MYVSMYLKEAENKISIRNTTVRIDHMYVSLVNKVKKGFIIIIAIELSK